MKFQLNENKFILQSFYKEKDNIFFNIGFIDKSKIIKYENVIYNIITKQISFRNIEFLRNDRNIIQTKVLDNIDLIIEKINKEL